MKVGVVAVVGRPNVGKSTLVNEIVGHKVSIVSDKPQTTRRRVLGIATNDDRQIVFVDTPGLHHASTSMGKILNEAARGSVTQVDAVIAVVDVSRAPTQEDRGVADMLRQNGWFEDGRAAKGILCMNKMDLLKAEHVQKNYEAFTELFPFSEAMMTSFAKKDNIEKLLELIESRLTEGELLFPADEFTDQSMRFLAAELIREKALRLTRAEVPHAIGCVVTDWDESDPRQTQISASILVEKQGQKAILIGRQGAMLKEIGTEARREIEDMLGGSVYLDLFVKVKENWRGNMDILRELEYF